MFGPPRSLDFERIRNLPRRPEGPPIDLTPAFRVPGGTMELRPIQSAALWEVEAAQGGFFPIGVGHGKTLISLLAASALGATNTLIIVPPHLVEQYESDGARYREHFDVPQHKVVSAGLLSSKTKPNLLEELAPDFIVIDEAHYFRHKKSTRTKRLLKYFRAHKNTRLVVLSGTMTSDSIVDYDHLLKLALRENAPHPFSYHELVAWAAAIDANVVPAPIGALKHLCKEHKHEEETPRKTARAAYRCRLVSTPGVVATREGAIGTSLTLTAWKPEVPKAVQAALKELRTTWRIGTPEAGYEELTDILSYHRYAHQLTQGFYYVWRWPEGRPDREWLTARADWHREARDFLSRRSRENLDSQGLLEDAAKGGSIKFRFWEPWTRLRDRYGRNGGTPPVDTVWIDDYIIRASLEWAESLDREGGERGIIWYAHGAIADGFARRGASLRIRLFDAGTHPEFLQGDVPHIAAAVRVHKEGKNLQQWNCSLFLDVLNGADFEQAIGRTHRPYQKADEVRVWIAQQTPELRKAWAGTLVDAEYLQEVQGQQKLLYATKLGGL